MGEAERYMNRHNRAYRALKDKAINDALPLSFNSKTLDVDDSRFKGKKSFFWLASLILA
jgi:hypothetical protein